MWMEWTCLFCEGSFPDRLNCPHCEGNGVIMIATRPLCPEELEKSHQGKAIDERNRLIFKLRGDPFGD